MKIGFLLVLAIALALSVGIATSFAYAQHDQGHHPGAAKPAMLMMDMEKCKKDMKEGEARLDRLVSKMNSAKGAAKTEAVADTVKEMIAQEKAMHKMCMSMMENMHGNMPMMGHDMKKGGGLGNLAFSWLTYSLHNAVWRL